MDYQPLNPEGDEIRLLTINDDQSTKITCTIVNVSLLSQPSYKALSYCWGSEKAVEKSIINGCEMEISANLDHALRQFRYEGHGPLWIDALCINQNDVSERNKQVLRMGDIYSKATEVIAWLGPAEHNSNKAMLLMRSFRKEAPMMLMTPGGGPISAEDCHAKDTESWDALDSLFGRAYWKRTWILQELALAGQIVFRCGSMGAEFIDLRGVDNVITRRRSSPDVPKLLLNEAHLRSVATILGLRKLDKKKDTLMLLTTALLRSREQSVTDLRDKVYGILSIAADGSKLVPLPTYAISAAEVYINLTRSLIVHSKRLDYIRFKSPFGKTRLDLPSWALDLSTPCFDASTPVWKSVLSIPVSWPNVKGRWDANATFTDSEHGNCCLLGAWGIVLGTVDGLGRYCHSRQRRT